MARYTSSSMNMHDNIMDKQIGSGSGIKMNCPQHKRSIYDSYALKLTLTKLLRYNDVEEKSLSTDFLYYI